MIADCGSYRMTGREHYVSIIHVVACRGVVGMLLKDEEKQGHVYGNLKTTRGVDLKVSRHVALIYHRGCFQSAQVITQKCKAFALV